MGRSIWAVVAGVLVTVVVTTLVDFVLHALHVYPPRSIFPCRPPVESVVPLFRRRKTTILDSRATRWAPHRPWHSPIHALECGG